jgi:hypothetical protein
MIANCDSSKDQWITSKRNAKMLKPICFLIAALALLGSCAAAPKPIAYQILAQGAHAAAAFSEPQFEVISSQQRLLALHRQLFAGRLPPSAPPAVDFSRALVLFVATAQKPSSGHRIELFPPERQGETLILRLAFHHPPPENVAATVLTQPYALLRVERTAGLRAVRFVDADGALLRRVELSSR